MNKRTEPKTYLAGVLAAVAGALLAQQGCGGDGETGGDGCPSSQTMCSGFCVDTATDPGHCGTCNHPCGVDQACVGGQCGCGADTIDCSGTCVAAATDPSNCGSCGTECDESEECRDGVCQCPVGMAPCSNGCSDLTSDALNCGQCNVTCQAAQACVASNCECPDGRELCFTECADTTSDSHYCGNCQTSCEQGEHCNNSTCEAISGCDQVSEDQYEGNDTCALARGLPDAVEFAPTAVTVNDPTLHHVNGDLDTDWYSIFVKEGFHDCSLLSGQCYFSFDIAFTPPDVAAYAAYQMCIHDGSCGGTGNCTTGADWNATAGRYELEHTWKGICGWNDDTTVFVKIARNGGEESCYQYGLEYQVSFTDEICP